MIKAHKTQVCIGLDAKITVTVTPSIANMPKHVVSRQDWREAWCNRKNRLVTSGSDQRE